MEATLFDHLTRRLARHRHSRRTLVRASLSAIVVRVGVDAHGGAPVAAARTSGGTPAASGTPFTCPGATAKEMNIDGAWFCDQLFALCTTAPCELSESDPTIANCRCIVEEAYAIGFKSCAERAPSGASLYSNFSTHNVNSAFRTMTCPESAPWANCLDVPCEIDAFNPAEAICQCQVVEIGPSLTFGGGCDTTTCASVIWSAAPPTFLGLGQYETGMACVNQTVTLPETCPSATPVAAATPSGG